MTKTMEIQKRFHSGWKVGKKERTRPVSNKMKKIAFVLVLCVLAGTLIGCLDQTPSQLKTKWESSDEGVISYLDADNYIGKTKTVEGTIVKTFKYTKGKIIFLNFHDPYQGYFTAIIWSSDWDNFPFAPEDYYKGKEVRVTGEIIEYKGSPEIVVRDPSQIEIAYTG